MTIPRSTSWPKTSISRADLGAITDPDAWSDAKIQAAVDACDEPRAAALALARAQATGEVPVALVAAILPGVREVVLAYDLLAIRTTGDRARVLAEVVQARRFPEVPAARPIEVLALFAAYRAGAAADTLVADARRLAAHADTAERGLLYAIAARAGDAALVRALRRRAYDPAGIDARTRTPRMLARTNDAVIAALPALARPVSSTRGLTARSEARSGRNEPCACGSGRKSKRCCVAASSVAGSSADEYVARAAARVSAAEVAHVQLGDLVRCDLAALSVAALRAALARFAAELRWVHASRVDRELARRGDVADAELRALRLEVALRVRSADALTAVEALAAGTLRGESSADATAAVRRVLPAIGELVVRARDAAAADARLGDATEREREQAHELAEARAELAAAREELAARDRVAVPAPAPIAVSLPQMCEPIERAQLAVQRTKTAELEGLVRAGIAERAELRAELAATAEALAVARTLWCEADEVERGAVDALDVPRAGATAVITPCARHAFARLPREIVDRTRAMIDALAAREPHAWAGVKQVKGMRTRIFEARIGIHYRLLFRASAGTLEALDVFQRGKLEDAVQRYA